MTGQKNQNKNHPLDSFSRQIKEKLEDHRMQVDDDCWSEIEQRLKSSERKKIPLWPWISSAAVAVAVIMLLLMIPPVTETGKSGYEVAKQKTKEGNQITPAPDSTIKELLFTENESGTSTVDDVYPDKINSHRTKLSGSGTLSASTTKATENEVYVNTQTNGINEIIADSNAVKPEIPATPKSGKKETDNITLKNLEADIAAGKNWEVPRKKQNSWQIAANLVSENGGTSKNSIVNTVNAGFKKSSAGNPSQPLLDENPVIIENGDNNESTIGNGITENEVYINNGFTDSNYELSDEDSSTSPSQSNTIKSSLSPDDYSNISFLPPISAGISIRKNLNRYWAVESGILYTYLKTNFENTEANSNQTANLTLHYIGIPLNVVAKIIDNPHWNLYASAGGMVEKGIWSEWTQHFYKNKKSTTTGGIDGFQWSVNAAIGATYKFQRNFGIYAEPRLSYFFDNEQPISIRTKKPLVFGVSIGFRYEF